MSYLNRTQRDAFSRSIKSDKLSHAYIVSGGDQSSRHDYIEYMLKEIFCESDGSAPCDECINCHKITNGNMEDLIYIKRDGNSIKVDQIKELMMALSNKPFTLRTVAVIEQADYMTPESQNKLLKCLEEPAPGTVIILSADNQFSLFQTIRSRCIVINVGDHSVDNDPELAERAANIVRYAMSNKPLNTIFNEVKEWADSGSDAGRLLDALEVFVRDVIVGKYSPELLYNGDNIAIVERIDWSKEYPFEKYLHHIENAKMEIRRNMNWKYTIKSLIINFKQEEVHG